jgi:uncharacterized caspase-like protein
VSIALLNTQEGRLYAQVQPQVLLNDTANKDGIFDALDVMERNMATGAGRDLAVIMFFGHGALIDSQFYLVPYGASTQSPSLLKRTSILADELQIQIVRIARHGHVLVLLDAFHATGLIGQNAVPWSDILRSALAASNVTVLTSATGNGVSFEDEAWQHGAFAKTFLVALTDAAKEVDSDRSGTISMAELTAWMASHLPMLTNGRQQLGIEMRFQGEIFAVGAPPQRSSSKEQSP